MVHRFQCLLAPLHRLVSADEHPADIGKYVREANRIAVGHAALLPIAAAWVASVSPRTAWLTLLPCLPLLATVLVHKLTRARLAGRVLLMVGWSSAVATLGLLMGPASRVQLMALPAVLLPFSLFGPEERRWIWPAGVLPVVTYVAVFESGLENLAVVEPWEARLLSPGMIAAAFGETFIRVSFLLRQHAEASRALQRALEEARAAVAAKETLLANISHEIRTPLNGILGMAGLLRNTSLNAAQSDCVETIERAGDGLLHLLNDALEYSKLEAGGLELERSRFAPSDVLDGVVEILAPTAQSKGIELHVDAPLCGITLEGDAYRLRQVLLNLGNNAIKFTTEGSVTLSARVESSPTSRLAFSVRDTGIGIPASRLDAVFNSYTQADPSMTRRYGGTGLGLTISKRLVELMGGQIGVRSDGDGSIFWFEVPAETIVRAPLSTLESRLRVGILARGRSWERQAALLLERRGHEVRPVRPASPYVDDLAHLLVDMLDVPSQAALLQNYTTRNSHLVLVCTHPHRNEATLAAESLGASVLPYPPTNAQVERALELHRSGSLPQQAPPSLQQRVLLVEDNPINQKVVAGLLGRSGCECIVASNGYEALSLLREQAFDVVLMDWQMPGIDGLETTRRLRLQEAPGLRVPVVALTANALPGDREKCLGAGMDGYLTKPLRPDDLTLLLERLERDQPSPSSFITPDTLSAPPPEPSAVAKVPGVPD